MRDSKNTAVYFFENFPAVKFDVRVIEKCCFKILNIRCNVIASHFSHHLVYSHKKQGMYI